MKKPDYCTQNNGDCLTCSLKNYGRDCQNKSIAARLLGSTKSPTKTKTSAENGRKGGRPKAYTDQQITEALKKAEWLCSWNNVLESDLPVFRALARKGLITKVSDRTDRQLRLTDSGEAFLTNK